MVMWYMRLIMTKITQQALKEVFQLNFKLQINLRKIKLQINLAINLLRDIMQTEKVEFTEKPVLNYLLSSTHK